MNNFDYLKCRTVFSFLHRLVACVLAFQRDPSRFKWSSITVDIVKNLRRDGIVTVQNQDSNSPMLVDEQFCLSYRQNEVLFPSENLEPPVLAFERD
jgi:hypothetical protein